MQAATVLVETPAAMQEIVRVGIPEGTGLAGTLVAMREIVRVAIPEGTDRAGILVAMREIVRVGMQAGTVLVEPLGAMLGIVREAIRPGILVGTGLEAMLVGLDLREMQGRAVLRPIIRGLRAILMRDFRSREGEAVTGRKDSGLSNSLSSDLNSLSRDHRLRVHDRVGLAGTTMPEQRERRAIAAEPVPVVVADVREVETNETSQS
jgi:hypothetical protein